MYRFALFLKLQLNIKKLNLKVIFEKYQHKNTTFFFSHHISNRRKLWFSCSLYAFLLSCLQAFKLWHSNGIYVHHFGANWKLTSAMEKKKFDDEWKRINFPANFHFVLLQWLIHLNYKIYSSTGEIFVLPTWEFCTNLKIIIIHLLPSYKVLMDCWLKNVIISSRKIFSSHFSFFW